MISGKVGDFNLNEITWNELLKPSIVGDQNQQINLVVSVQSNRQHLKFIVLCGSIRRDR